MRKRNSKYIYSKTILNNIFMISGKRSGEGTPLPTNFDNLQDSITYTYGTDCTLEYSSTPNNGASSGILKVAQCSETFPLDNFIDHFYSSAVDLKELSKSMFWKLMLAQFLLTLMYKKGFGPKTIHMNQRPKNMMKDFKKSKSCCRRWTSTTSKSTMKTFQLCTYWMHKTVFFFRFTTSVLIFSRGMERVTSGTKWVKLQMSSALGLDCWRPNTPII